MKLMELFIPVLQALKLMRASHFLGRCVCVLFVLIRHSSSGWTAMYVCMYVTSLGNREKESSVVKNSRLQRQSRIIRTRSRLPSSPAPHQEILPTTKDSIQIFAEFGIVSFGWKFWGARCGILIVLGL